MIVRWQTPRYFENIYLHYDENTLDGVLFDPGSKMEEVDSFIEENKINLRAILLTHGHGDHIGGVEYFKEKYNVKVYAHIEEKDVLENESYNYSMSIGGKKVELKDIEYFKADGSLEFGSIKLEYFHTPGHTKGGCVFITSDGIISGDTLFKMGIGRYDLYSGDYEALKNSIVEVIFKFDDMDVYPGHGEKTTIEKEKKYNPFFRLK